MVTRLAVFGALLLSALCAAAQQQKQPPTFHAATHLVQVNVVVHDKEGRPALGLTKDDFAISDRGKPQTISVFSFDAAGAATAPQAPLPPNTFSDEAKYHGATSGGVTIILLDNLNTLESTASQPYEDSPFWLEALALASAKRRLLEFLKQLNSQDHIAIYGLSDTLHVLCDFTCNRDQLLAVVTRYDTSSKTRKQEVEPGDFHAQVTPEPAADARMTTAMQLMASFNNERRAEVTMAALDAIASHVADLPGRKNLLWLTGNLPFSGTAIARTLARANLVAYPIDARGLLPRESGENKEGFYDQDAFATGDVGKHSNYSQPVGIDTMQQMADATGGRAFVNTNDLTGAIRTALEDSSSTYTLGFYVEPASLDDKFHELKVQLKRPGFTVRQPKGYFALKDAPVDDNERRRNFARALRSPIDSSAIPLQVTVEHSNQPTPDSLQIQGLVGIGTLHLSQDSAGRNGAVYVYVIEQDAAGNVLGQTANRMKLALTEQQYQTYQQSGISFRKAVKPLAGATTLRVLVQDQGTSVVGSVLVPLAQVK